ncbi:MAG: tetratricopeptide repeat protein [Brevinematales bacterium]
MYGRLVVPFLWLSLFSLSFSAITRPKIEVDGFYFSSLSQEEMKGIRAKGVADMLYEKRQWNQAIRYYEMAAQYIPSEADIYFQLGRIYDQRKLYSLAYKYYLKAAECYQLPENQRKSRESSYYNQVYRGILLVKMSVESKTYLDQAWKIYNDLKVFERELEYDYPDVYVLYRQFEEFLTFGFAEKKKTLSHSTNR